MCYSEEVSSDTQPETPFDSLNYGDLLGGQVYLVQGSTSCLGCSVSMETL